MNDSAGRSADLAVNNWAAEIGHWRFDEPGRAAYETPQPTERPFGHMCLRRSFFGGSGQCYRSITCSGRRGVFC